MEALRIASFGAWFLKQPRRLADETQMESFVFLHPPFIRVLPRLKEVVPSNKIIAAFIAPTMRAKAGTKSLFRHEHRKDFRSRNEGDTWDIVADDLPPVFSVSVATRSS